MSTGRKSGAESAVHVMPESEDGRAAVTAGRGNAELDSAPRAVRRGSPPSAGRGGGPPCPGPARTRARDTAARPLPRAGGASGVPGPGSRGPRRQSRLLRRCRGRPRRGLADAQRDGRRRARRGGERIGGRLWRGGEREQGGLREGRRAGVLVGLRGERACAEGGGAEEVAIHQHARALVLEHDGVVLGHEL